MQVLNAATPTKRFSWSFSAVENFHTCPRKYYHQVVKKDVSDDTTYRVDGQAVHDYMRDAVRGVHPLPNQLGHWQRWIDELHADGGKVLAEMKYAFTADGQPCDYFDKRAHPWCRSNLDVLKFGGHQPDAMARTALVWDWKTGRVKADEDQLMLYAMHIFLRFKTIDHVKGGLIFLRQDLGPHIPRNDCTYELLIDRDDVQQWWSRYIHKVRALERAHKTNDFPPVRSGLCRRHCAVSSCEYCGE